LGKRTNLNKFYFYIERAEQYTVTRKTGSLLHIQTRCAQRANSTKPEMSTKSEPVFRCLPNRSKNVVDSLSCRRQSFW